MKNHITVLLIGLMACFAFGQENKAANDFIMLDNISLNNKIYSLKTKTDKFEFVLKICVAQDTCKTTQSFAKDISPTMFSQGIINFVDKEFDSTLVDSTKKINLQPGEREHIESLVLKRTSQELVIVETAKNDLERTLGEVERAKNQYSGKLIINKKIPYQIVTNEKKNNETDPKTKKIKKLDFVKKDDGKLTIIDAKVKFFNNKATSIYIKAEFENDGGKKQKLIFLNNKFSVAVRYFNYYGSTVTADTEDDKTIKIDYNDVFDYESDQYYNYSVANDQISLSTVHSDSMTVKVQQRRFFDYFTAIIYSDVLSFNTENSNSLLNAQAKLLIPLNLRNPGIWSFARQFSATANVALSNSFSDENRFIAITSEESFSHFDLLKKNNLYGKLDYQAINLEYKRLFMNIAVGYSAAFYRTGFQYTQIEADTTNMTINRQLISLGHGPYINFEIRPQSNFGADLIVGFEDLNYNDSKSINGRSFKGDIIEDDGHNHLGFKYNLFNIEANFYWLTSDDKTGGVYAKIGTYYHTESHEIFPQLMVGYATNLTSFVNRFKPKTGAAPKK